MRAIDVSGYQPRDLTALIQEHQVAHVVVKLYLPEETISQDHSRAQIESARANGCSVGIYIFAYRDLDPRKSIRDAIALARSCGLLPSPLWIDAETYEGVGPDVHWLNQAMAECWAHMVRPGIYTGAWYWQEHMANTALFADLPLWVAQYDGLADLSNVALFGGWTQVTGKQYTADPVDLSVFALESTQ